MLSEVINSRSFSAEEIVLILIVMEHALGGYSDSLFEYAYAKS